MDPRCCNLNPIPHLTLAPHTLRSVHPVHEVKASMLAQSLGQISTGRNHSCHHQAKWKEASPIVIEGISQSQTVREEGVSLDFPINSFPEEKQQNKLV